MGSLQDTAALIGTLRGLIGDRPVALLDWPSYPNAGDHFIWLGQKVILRQHLKSKIIFGATMGSLNFFRLARLPEHVAIVIQGGGNFGDLYYHHQRLRNAVIAAFPDRLIISLPQTIKFEGEETAQHFARLAAGHQNLHIFARDQGSLEVLTGQMGVARAYLATDSAFALQGIVDSLVQQASLKVETEELRLLRDDREVGAGFSDRSNSVDWPDAPLAAILASQMPALWDIDLARPIFTSRFDQRSWTYLAAAVRMFAPARRIVTDRLHGFILAKMMGKEVTLIDNSYGKNAGFARTWGLDGAGQL